MSFADRPPPMPKQENNEDFKNYLGSLPRHNDAVEISKMSKIGSGGSHDVLVNQETDGFVLKIDRALLSRVTKIAEVTPEMRQAAQGVILNKEKEHTAICDAFGKDHCLAEKYFLDKVYSENENRAVDTILTVQEKSEAFKNPTKIDFSATYLDKDARKISEADYSKLIAMAGGKDFDEAIFLKYEKSVKSVFEKIDNDDAFAKNLSDFIERFREYYAKNQHILDFVGNENVLLYEENGEWKYQVGTVFKGNGSTQEFKSALETLETNPEQLKEGPGKEGVLYNTLANARAINATAHKLGLPPVFNFSVSEKGIATLREIVNFENIKMDENAGVLKDKLLSDFEARPSEEKKKLIEALGLALEIHADQKPRPDGPYINHILRVAERISNYFEIKDPSVITAGLLHDSVEDQFEKLSKLLDDTDEATHEKAFQYIKEKFGEKAASIILAVTNSDELDNLPSEESNAKYVEHVADVIADSNVFYVKLSDFSDNGLNIETVLDKNRQAKLARKYLPLYQIFIDRLQQEDIKIPENKKQEISSKLLSVKNLAENIIASHQDF